MSYIIYHRETTRFLNTKNYKTESAAKGALTREANALGTFLPTDYAIADAIDFHNNIEKMVTRVNLMSKKEYQERVNTPIYCSPAFESYWSM